MLTLAWAGIESVLRLFIATLLGNVIVGWIIWNLGRWVRNVVIRLLPLVGLTA